MPALVAFGLSMALVNAAYYIAISRLSVGVAISLQYTAPVLLLGVAAIAGSRRPGPAAWLAAFLTVAGAVLVSRAYGGLGGTDAKGVAAALASAVTFASYLLSAEAAGRRGLQPATTLFWGFAVGVLFWSVAVPWWSWPVAKLLEPGVALAVVGVGVVGTLIPFFLAVGAVRVLSPATAGIAATAEPPFATVRMGLPGSATRLGSDLGRRAGGRGRGCGAPRGDRPRGSRRARGHALKAEAVAGFVAYVTIHTS